jgi:DNA-binding MarR family transcriptional regulator
MNNVASFNGEHLRNAPPSQADAVEQLTDRMSRRLRDLQDKIQSGTTIAGNDLGRIRDEVHSFAVRGHSDESMETNLQMDVRRARKLRQMRKRIFGKDMFSGPGWDILLHLFETHVSQLRDTVGNVCDGAELPSATATRWMGRLEHEQLIRLRDDQFDGRRRFVELTDSGVQLMTNYFSAAAPHQITA